MAYGLQINTSGGVANTLDVDTLLFYGTLSQYIPQNTAAGPIYYINYPAGWVNVTNNPNGSLVMVFHEYIYTGTPPDPAGGFDTMGLGNYFVTITFEDANNRVKIEVTVATPADRALRIRFMFVMEGA